MPIRPTLRIRSVPQVVHSRRIVRRVAVTAFMRPPWTSRSASASRAGVGVRHQNFFHQIEFLEYNTGASNNASKRVIGHVDRHLRRLGDAAIETGKERAAAGQDDALVHDVSY